MAEEDKTLLFGGEEGPIGVKPPYIVIVEGPHKGARFALQEGVNTIGSLDECQVVLDDQSVSRNHSEITFSNGSWMIKDLQSKNGTLVNGATITEGVVIGHKDLIRVGIYTLRLITQTISQDEELDIPQQEVGEWGTVVASPDKTADTASFEVPPGVPAREITARNSPLEEKEELEQKTFIKQLAKGGRFPKARLWVLWGLLFLGILGGGLYFYWKVVLTSGENAAKKAKPAAPVTALPGTMAEPQTLPLGPPEPPKPQTVPVFLDCIANPMPAMVRFQEKEIGKTPLKINVELIPDQDYDIEALFDMPELQEKYTERLHFKVSKDQSTVPLLFHAPLGTIKVVSLPRDVSFYLEAYFDYNKFQPHQVKLQNLVLNKPIFAPFGRYIVELRKPKQIGDASHVVDDIIFRREFILKEDQPAFTLDLNEGNLQQFPAEIHSIPAGADVYIDEKKVGVTPFTGSLPLGVHRLTLRKEGYFETVQDITTDINSPFRAEITMKTSPAGEKINQAKSFSRQGLYQEAVQYLSEVFNLNPTPHETAEARYLLGQIFLQAKDYSKAIGYFEQAKENEDFKYWAKLGIASALADQHMEQQALLPLVEVLLNAKDEAVQKAAHEVLRKVSPLRSVVYIQSDPVGAQVYLNDKKLAQVTPILLHEVSLGNYRIRIEKAGFEPQTLNLDLSINEFNPIFTKLKPLAQ